MTDALLSAVTNALESAGLVNKTLLVGLSGGADSVALLHALCHSREQHRCRILACHVQHGLRGESSRLDEQFCRELCGALHVPLTVADANLTGTMDDAGIETCARDERLRIFAQQLQSQHAHALLLAHHQGDQAETVLMRLCRGAGLDGLCGMRTIAPFGQGLVIRPFLSLDKQALLAALLEWGATHREDESNAHAVTPRNALRLQVLPELERLFPGASRHMAEGANALQADAEALGCQGKMAYSRALLNCPPVFALDCAPLQAEHEAISRRVLRRWYLHAASLMGITPDERALSHADTLSLLCLLHADAGTVHNLPLGLLVTRGVRHLHMGRQDGQPLVAAQPIHALSVQELEASPVDVLGFRVQYEACQGDAEPPRTACSAVLSPAVLSLTPVLRTPLAGDRIHPMGASGSKPLRRYLTDKHIDPAFRAALPVLAAGDRVLWIPGLCTSQELCVSHTQPDSVLISAQGDIPYIPNKP